MMLLPCHESTAFESSMSCLLEDMLPRLLLARCTLSHCLREMPRYRA